MLITNNSTKNINLTSKHDWEIIEVFSDFDVEKEINIENGEKITYLVVNTKSKSDFIFNVNHENSCLDLNFLFVWKKNKTNKWNIICNINASNTKVNIYILSFLTDKSEIDVDWNITINKNVKNVKWHLVEEYIILWEKIKIKTKPILNIYSKDIQASHGAKIEKIDNEKLFYLTSKWIDNLKAKNLIIDGYLTTLFDKFKNTKETEKLKQKIIKNL